MKKLKINKGFRSAIYALLLKNNNLKHVFYINNDVLVINREDFEMVDRLLSNGFHKYKVVTE